MSFIVDTFVFKPDTDFTKDITADNKIFISKGEKYDFKDITNVLTKCLSTPQNRYDFYTIGVKEYDVTFSKTFAYPNNIFSFTLDETMERFRCNQSYYTIDLVDYSKSKEVLCLNTHFKKLKTNIILGPLQKTLYIHLYRASMPNVDYTYASPSNDFTVSITTGALDVDSDIFPVNEKFIEAHGNQYDFSRAVNLKKIRCVTGTYIRSDFHKDCMLDEFEIEAVVNDASNLSHVPTKKLIYKCSTSNLIINNKVKELVVELSSVSGNKKVVIVDSNIVSDLETIEDNDRVIINEYIKNQSLFPKLKNIKSVIPLLGDSIDFSNCTNLETIDLRTGYPLVMVKSSDTYKFPPTLKSLRIDGAKIKNLIFDPSTYEQLHLKGIQNWERNMNSIILKCQKIEHLSTDEAIDITITNKPFLKTVEVENSQNTILKNLPMLTSLKCKNVSLGTNLNIFLLKKLILQNNSNEILLDLPNLEYLDLGNAVTSFSVNSNNLRYLKGTFNVETLDLSQYSNILFQIKGSIKTFYNPKSISDSTYEKSILDVSIENLDRDELNIYNPLSKTVYKGASKYNFYGCIENQQLIIAGSKLSFVKIDKKISLDVQFKEVVLSNLILNDLSINYDIEIYDGIENINLTNINANNIKIRHNDFKKIVTLENINCIDLYVASSGRILVKNTKSTNSSLVSRFSLSNNDGSDLLYDGNPIVVDNFDSENCSLFSYNVRELTSFDENSKALISNSRINSLFVNTKYLTLLNNKFTNIECKFLTDGWRDIDKIYLKNIFIRNTTLPAAFVTYLQKNNTIGIDSDVAITQDEIVIPPVMSKTDYDKLLSKYFVATIFSLYDAQKDMILINDFLKYASTTHKAPDDYMTLYPFRHFIHEIVGSDVNTIPLIIDKLLLSETVILSNVTIRNFFNSASYKIIDLGFNFQEIFEKINADFKIDVFPISSQLVSIKSSNFFKLFKSILDLDPSPPIPAPRKKLFLGLCC